MSEAGWRAFLAADGVDDWVVLHGGATAAFRVGSMADAARLAQAIAEVPEVADVGAVLTIAGSRLSVRITRDMWQLEAHHADLARAISAVARSAQRDAGTGGGPGGLAGHRRQTGRDRPRLLACRARLCAHGPDNGVDPLGHGSTVWMQELDAAKPLRHAMHVDVSVAKEQAPGAARRGPGRRRPHRGRVPGALDALGPGRQSRLHRRLAGRRHDDMNLARCDTESERRRSCRIGHGSFVAGVRAALEGAPNHRR